MLPLVNFQCCDGASGVQALAWLFIFNIDPNLLSIVVPSATLSRVAHGIKC
jgi:hypothetical protein